jgi:hypothetical protein
MTATASLKGFFRHSAGDRARVADQAGRAARRPQQLTARPLEFSRRLANVFRYDEADGDAMAGLEPLSLCFRQQL